MISELRRVDLYIDGESVAPSGGRRFRSLDPASGEPIADVADADEADIEGAVAAAAAAFPAWRDTLPVDRGRILARLAALIHERVEALSRLETRDNGKPLRLARRDVEGAARYFEFYAGLVDKLGGETIPLGPDYLSYTRREPHGPIAEILPWNAPLNQAARALAPALATGNTVVAKPSEFTPLTTVELAALASEAGLPAGVLNVLTGDGRVGRPLAQHPRIRKVGFTGSVATGRLIAAVGAERLIPVSLELGGKSANIVFADADLELAVPGAFAAFTLNSGQICSAGSRLLVAAELHDEVVARLAELAAAARVGPGLTEPHLGPLTTARQQEIVRGYLELARSEGATLLPDPPPAVPAAGNFVPPTVLAGVDNSMRVAREEIFGPVLSVIPFGDEAEAVAIANDSPFGLVAGVWTRDLSRAHRVAAALEVGQVFVNEYFAGGEETPFGGVKESGLGRLKGVEAARFYTQLKTVTVKV